MREAVEGRQPEQIEKPADGLRSEHDRVLARGQFDGLAGSRRLTAARSARALGDSAPDGHRRLRRIAAAVVRRDADHLHEGIRSTLLAALVAVAQAWSLLRDGPDAVSLRRRERRPPRTRPPGRCLRSPDRAPRWRGRRPSLPLLRRRARSPGRCRRGLPRPLRRRAARAARSRRATRRRPHWSRRARRSHAAEPPPPQSGRRFRSTGSACSRRSAASASARASPGQAPRPRVSGGALRDLEGVHATPTCTSRKRAGAVPWDTRITWPGSPLPQSSREIMRHSAGEQTASQLPQNSGVTPA